MAREIAIEHRPEQVGAAAFEGQVGEQATMFFLDLSGNALEFKAFNDLSQLFAK